MRMELGRRSIRIIAETEQDEAYFEDTLGVRNNGDSVDANLDICVLTDETEERDAMVLELTRKSDW